MRPFSWKSASEKQTKLLGLKSVHYLALEAIIFKVRVKVAQPAVLGRSAKSQAYQRQPESAESRKCRECVAKAKPGFLRLNRNHRQDPQGPRKGLYPGFAVTLIKMRTPRSWPCLGDSIHSNHKSCCLPPLCIRGPFI